MLHQERTVQRIGSRLGGVIQDAVGGPAVFRRVGSTLDLELLDRLGADHAHGRVVAAFAHRLRAVDQHAGPDLPAARYDRTARRGVGVVGEVHLDPGIQAGEREVAPESSVHEQRQLLDRLVVDNLAEVAPVRLQQGRRRRDLHGFRYFTDLELDVDSRRSVHAHSHLGNFGFPEARHFHREGVFAGGKIDKTVPAVGSGDGLLRQTSLGMAQDKRGARHSRTRGVGYGAGDGSTVLGKSERSCKKHANHSRAEILRHGWPRRKFAR